MTDKERLEELETKYSTLTVSSEKNGTEYTEVDVEDLVFLIQNGFKQAERAEELEKQNKRYKQALEFYADEETYEMKFVANTDEIGVPLTVIELDEGKKARKALEGEE